MIFLLGYRTIFYMFKRFKDWHLSEKPIENDQLIPIYCEELFFNFAMFFYIVIKNDHDSKLAEYSKSSMSENEDQRMTQVQRALLSENVNYESQKQPDIIIETESEEDDITSSARKYSSPLFSPKSLRRSIFKNESAYKVRKSDMFSRSKADTPLDEHDNDSQRIKLML